MRARVDSARLDTVVAACLLQRRAGGDLARLLRQTARAMEEEARLSGELRAATAQARFTGVLVVLLPLGGALLAELASPGWIAGLWSSFLTGWLVGIAVVLQVVAAVLITAAGPGAAVTGAAAAGLPCRRSGGDGLADCSPERVADAPAAARAARGRGARPARLLRALARARPAAAARRRAALRAISRRASPPPAGPVGSGPAS